MQSAMKFWCRVVLGTLLVAGCRPSGERADGKIPLRFSSYTSSPAEVDLVNALVAEFNQANPDIAVTYEPVPGQYYPKMLTMLVSHTAPDVFYLDIFAFRPFLAKGILRPLDDFLATSKSTHREDFLPQLVSAFADGKTQYGIPKDFNTMALFYNKAMFDAKGMAYPDARWDMARFRAAAARLTTPDKKQFGFALTHDNVDRYLPMAAAFGASLYDAQGKCGLASPEAVAAMQFYSDLSLRDHSSIYPAEVGSSWTGDAFGRGSVAMVFEGGWLIPYLNTTFPGLGYGLAPLPLGPAGVRSAR